MAKEEVTLTSSAALRQALDAKSLACVNKDTGPLTTMEEAELLWVRI